MIRGSVIRMARAWVERTYGPEVIDNALREVLPGDVDAIGGMLLAASMYPIDSWNRFLAALARQVRAAKGVSEQAFYREIVRGSVSGATQTVFKFLLGVFQPPSVLQRLPVIAGRIYEDTQLTVVTNAPGRFVAELRVQHEAVYENARICFLHTVVFLAEMARAKNPRAVYSRDEALPRGYLLEVTLEYMA